jgi:hypothetical protein
MPIGLNTLFPRGHGFSHVMHGLLRRVPQKEAGGALTELLEEARRTRQTRGLSSPLDRGAHRRGGSFGDSVTEDGPDRYAERRAQRARSSVQ